VEDDLTQQVRPRAPRAAAAAALRGGTVRVAIGLGFFGLSTYVFTAVVLRSLGPAQFADFNLFWGLAYGLGLGAMLPFEQEVSRRTATAVHTGGHVGPVLSAAVVVSTAFAVTLALLALPFVLTSGHAGAGTLWVITLFAFLALGVAYVSRGALSGRGSFGRYSGQLVAEGSARLVLVGICVAVGIASTGGYAAIVPVALAVAVVLTWPRHARPERTSLPVVRNMAAMMAPLLVASIISMTLVNLGPVAIRYVQDSRNPSHDGSYLAAAFIARLPIFAFAAIQAVLMPRLARSVAQRDAAGFRGTVLRVLALTAALGVLAVAGVAVAGPWLLDVLGGPQYHLGRLDMVLLTVGFACYLLTLVLQPAAVALGRHRASAVIWVVGAMTFVLAWLLPTDASTAVSLAVAVVSLTVSAGLAALVWRALATDFPQRTAYST
jgi:O-antigen/teichoic acid export membrane protein